MVQSFFFFFLRDTNTVVYNGFKSNTPCPEFPYQFIISFLLDYKKISVFDFHYYFLGYP